MDDRTYNHALTDPKSVFDTPADVVASDLPRDRKRAVLERWRDDARQLMRAEGEGMDGGERARLGDIEAALERLDEGGATGIGWDVAGVFEDRDGLERAIQAMQSHGFNRHQLSIVGTGDALREKLGLDTERTEGATEARAAVDSSEEENLGALVGAVPSFLGAALGAGAVIATGGAALAAVAAAVAGGAGGAVLGRGAAVAIDSKVEGDYDQDLSRGGILLLIHPADRADVDKAQEIVARHGGRSYTVRQTATQ